MEKIKNIISKINFTNIFLLYIIMQPVIDIITSLCVRNISEKLTLGVFIRTIFVLYLMLYTIIKTDKKNKYQILIYYSFIALYCIVYLINSVSKYGFSILFAEIKGLIKTFYFPIVLASLLILSKQEKYMSKQKYLNISLAIYVLTIVICKIFNVGYPTYPFKENIGTIGLFYAGNEISAIIAMLSPVCFAIFISQKFSIINAVLCALTVFAMLEVGTKVAFISIIGLIILTLIVLVVKLFKKEGKNIYKQFITLLLIGIITTLFVGNTSGGKNFGIKPMLFKQSSYNQSLDSKKNKKGNKKTDATSLLSGRNNFLDANIKRYNQSSIMDKLVGMGYLYPTKNVVQERKLVEIDYFDIYFCHGIFGTVIYVAPLAIIIFILIKKFFANFIDNIKNNKLIFTIYSVLIGFGIALMAGHVFTAPAVSMFLVLIIFEIFSILYYEKDKKNE